MVDLLQGRGAVEVPMRHARREIRPDRDSDFRELTGEQVTKGPEIVVLGEDDACGREPAELRGVEIRRAKVPELNGPRGHSAKPPTDPSRALMLLSVTVGTARDSEPMVPSMARTGATGPHAKPPHSVTEGCVRRSGKPARAGCRTRGQGARGARTWVPCLLVPSAPGCRDDPSALVERQEPGGEVNPSQAELGARVGLSRDSANTAVSLLESRNLVLRPKDRKYRTYYLHPYVASYASQEELEELEEAIEDAAARIEAGELPEITAPLYETAPKRQSQPLRAVRAAG